MTGQEVEPIKDRAGARTQSHNLPAVLALSLHSVPPQHPGGSGRDLVGTGSEPRL